MFTTTVLPTSEGREDFLIVQELFYHILNMIHHGVESARGVEDLESEIGSRC